MLEYSGDIVVTSIPAGPVVLWIPFTQSRVIRVENIQPADLVRSIQCEQSSARMRFSVYDELELELDDKSPPMAGDLFICPSGTGDRNHLTTLIRFGAGVSKFSRPSLKPGLFDVRYEPNVEYAWAAGFDHYCASTLQWTEVRLGN
ncbi:MAG: hypothetical protein AMXMBFR47_22030 [Planctomycetota bacterium]